MRIDSMNQVSQVYRMNKPKKINTAYQASFNDSVEISQLGKDIQIAKKAVSAAPDKSPANSNPKSVIIGLTALRRACLYITTHSLNPFALAKLT